MTAYAVESVQIEGGIYVRSVFLPFKGTTVPQHTHSEDHPTMVCAGRARLYVDGKFDRDIDAGSLVLIKAGRKHLFEALEDNTRISCLWREEVAMRMEETTWRG